MKDTFNAEMFRLSPEDLKTSNGQQQFVRTPRKDRRTIDFYPLPKAVIDGIVAADYMPALVVAVVIYETWYYDYEKRNPIRLTSASLQARGISRDQKRRALTVLENTAQYLVERFPRRNPLVMMKWKLVKD
jgi:hypothetical protein